MALYQEAGAQTQALGESRALVHSSDERVNRGIVTKRQVGDLLHISKALYRQISPR